jgi:IS5 family transposase
MNLFDLFAHEHRAKRIDQKDPLLALDELIDFQQLVDVVEAIAPRKRSDKGGRPPYPTEIMLRVIILKRLNNLSNDQMEFLLNDRMSFQRFTKLSHSPHIPDANTIWVFEERIGEASAKALFEAVERQITQHGYSARKGQIVDATIVPVPKQRIRSKEKEITDQQAMPIEWSAHKRAQKDIDATWVTKHGKQHFGYKLGVNVDVRCKVIRTIDLTTAKDHDINQLENLIDMNNTHRDFFADKGYASQPKEKALADKGLNPRVQHKKAKGKPMGKQLEKRNKTIAKTRSRVEHIFGAIEQMGGKCIRVIGQQRANFVMTMMATVYNLKRFVFLRKSGFSVYA